MKKKRGQVRAFELLQIGKVPWSDLLKSQEMCNCRLSIRCGEKQFEFEQPLASLNRAKLSELVFEYFRIDDVFARRRVVVDGKAVTDDDDLWQQPGGHVLVIGEEVHGKGDVVLNGEEWEELVDSVQKLQLHVLEGNKSLKRPCGGTRCCVCGTKEFPQISLFKCAQCPDFIICEECEVQMNDTHDRLHPLIKFSADSPRSRKEKTIDFEYEDADLFRFFDRIADAGQLKDLMDSYKKYKSIKQNIEVSLQRRDYAIYFQIHNNTTTSLPPRLDCVYAHGGINKIVVHMGPHELLPGAKKTLMFNAYPEIYPLAPRNASIQLVDAQNNIIYTSTRDGSSSNTNAFTLSRPSLCENNLNYSASTLQTPEEEYATDVISTSIDDNGMNDFESIDWKEYTTISDNDYV